MRRRGGWISLTAGLLATAGTVALPTSAGSQTAIAPTGASGISGPQASATAPAIGDPAGARIKLHLQGASDHRVHVGNRVKLVGRIHPFVAGEHVGVLLSRDGQTLKRKSPLVHKVPGKDAGGFHLRSNPLIKPGDYHFRAFHKESAAQAHDAAATPKFDVKYPDLDPGAHGEDVRLFNGLLADEGYYTSQSNSYSGPTDRAVLAFRKVNGMERTFNASPGIFKALAAGHGGFKLKYPGAGKHVEVDISRQVMVLADHGKAQHVFHVSTGAPATPTIRGHYRFYRREPGYNSHGMYYSVYFQGGYATHGYDPVPSYPASHGCVRNPIPNSVFIYNWVKLGMSIYLYD
jgi:hypothetical protein